MYHLQETYAIVFDTKIENISLRGEGRRGNGALSWGLKC